MNSQIITEELITTLQGIKDGKEWEARLNDGAWFSPPKQKNLQAVLHYLSQEFEIRLKPFVPEPSEGYRLLTQEECDGLFIPGAKFWKKMSEAWEDFISPSGLGRGSCAVDYMPVAVPLPLEPVSGYDGWIEWKGTGTSFPLEPHMEAVVRLRNGMECNAATSWITWGHANRPTDVVAYRIVETPPAPQYVPWTFETFPRDLRWLRRKSSVDLLTVFSIHSGGLDIFDSGYCPFHWILENMLTDLGEPCGTLKQ